MTPFSVGAKHFNQESNYATTCTQTIDKPTSFINVTRMGAATLPQQQPSRPRIKSTHRTIKRPNRLKTKKPSSATLATNSTTTSSVSYSSNRTPTTPTTLNPRTHTSSTNTNAGYKWATAGNQDYLHTQRIETQKNFTAALMSGTGITVNQILPGLRREGVDDYKETVLTVTQCVLDLQRRAQSLIDVMKSSPTLQTVLEWTKKDYGASSVAVWVEVSTPGDFVVACDTRHCEETIHWKDDKTKHTKQWMPDEERAIALRVRGSGTIFSTVRDESTKAKATVTNNKKKHTGDPFEHSVMMVPIFGRQGLVVGVLLLRDKCKQILQTKTETTQIMNYEEFDTIDEVIGSYVSSACTVHVLQHKCHASTQTDLTGLAIDRSKIWVDLFRLPIDVAALSLISTKDAIELIENASKELMCAQHCYLFLCDTMVVPVADDHSDISNAAFDSPVPLFNTSPESVLGYNGLPNDPLPWKHRLWTTCAADIDEDHRADRRDIGRGARFVHIENQPNQRLLYVGRASDVGTSDDSNSSNSSSSSSSSNNSSKNTFTSVHDSDPYSTVSRCATERKSLRSYVSYPSTPVTGIATGQYTHSTLSVPVFIGNDDANTKDNHQTLLGVILVSNKIAPDNEPFHLPQFSESDATMLEGFSLLADGILRRACRLRARESKDQADREEKARRLKASHEMEHWESNLRSMMITLSSVQTLKELHKALHECCTQAVRCENVVLVVGPKGAHISINQETKMINKERKTYESKGWSVSDDPERLLIGPEQLHIHHRNRRNNYTCWYSSLQDPIMVHGIGSNLKDVVENGTYVASGRVTVVENENSFDAEQVEKERMKMAHGRADKNAAVHNPPTKQEADSKLQEQNHQEQENLNYKTMLKQQSSLIVPVWSESDGQDKHQKPYAMICCSLLNWTWNGDKFKNIFTEQQDDTTDTSTIPTIPTVPSATETNGDDALSASYSTEELSKYALYDTLNNPPHVQALLFLQLVSKQVQITIGRINEKHKLEFDLSRQTVTSLGSFPAPPGNCEFLSAAKVDTKHHLSALQQNMNPDRVDLPSDRLHRISVHDQPQGRHRLGEYNRIETIEEKADTDASDSKTEKEEEIETDTPFDLLARAWCPTWWEYLESCQKTLHADQLILLSSAEGLAHMTTELSPDETNYLNVVSSFSGPVSSSTSAVSNDHTDSPNNWFEIISPNHSAFPKATFVPFHTEQGSGLNAWANTVHPASSPTSTRGKSREMELSSAMGTEATGTIEKDFLITQVKLGDHLYCKRYFYKLDLADGFPTCLAMVVRAGRDSMTEEESNYFRATIDVVAGQLRLALLTNSFRTRIARINMALSIPATLLDVEGSPRDRLRLMLRKTCETVHCSSARLALLNPDWEEMQVVAGWPPLKVEQLTTFPNYVRLGEPVFLDDQTTLRTSIVGRNNVVLGVLDLYQFRSVEEGMCNEIVGCKKEMNFVRWAVTKWFLFLMEKMALEMIVEESSKGGEGGGGGGGSAASVAGNKLNDSIQFHGVFALEALERTWDTVEMDQHQLTFQSKLIETLKVEVENATANQ